MDRLTEIVREVVQGYAADTYGGNCRLFALESEDKAGYALVVLDYPQRQFAAQVYMLVRVVNGFVVIDGEHTNRPLRKALEQHGIPTNLIIHAYAGEQTPDKADVTT